MSLAAGLLLGCATEQPYVWASSGTLPASSGNGSLAATAETLVHPRDTLLLFVRNQAAFSGEFAVREDGAFLLPGVGDVPAAGLTTEQIRADVAGRLKDMLVAPQVSIAIMKRAPVRVSVVGEVKTPGVYELGRDRSLLAALAAAGWLTDFAGRDRIFVVRREAPSPRLRFRASELTSPSPAVAAFSLRDGDVVSAE